MLTWGHEFGSRRNFVSCGARPVRLRADWDDLFLLLHRLSCVGHGRAQETKVNSAWDVYVVPDQRNLQCREKLDGLFEPARGNARDVRHSCAVGIGGIDLTNDRIRRARSQAGKSGRGALGTIAAGGRGGGGFDVEIGAGMDDRASERVEFGAPAGTGDAVIEA